MTLARLTEVLAPAAASGVGLGAFNVISIEHAEALTAAAEGVGTPVVLQISQNAVRYHGDLAPIGLATLALARNGAVPVVVHLDHATDVSLVNEAIELGFGSMTTEYWASASSEVAPYPPDHSTSRRAHRLILPRASWVFRERWKWRPAEQVPCAMRERRQ